MDIAQDLLINRFIKYAKVNTRSNGASQSTPSTPEQVDFLLALADELTEIGLSDVYYNKENAYLTATIPSNLDEDTLTVGFITHVDTADFNSININPQIQADYTGGDIILNEILDVKLSPTEFPRLNNYIGQTLITTDGTTLLGSDDKAGITSVVSYSEYLISHPEIPHGDIRLAFGPDEEIGARGAKKFDVEAFNANFAYTVDGGPVGNLTFENFNARQININIHGLNVHPGSAKNTMINALLVGARLVTSLPKDEVPEKTEDYEGYYALMSQSGTIDFVQQEYYIRDHDFNKLNQRTQFIIEQINRINTEFGEDVITYEVVNQYLNMEDQIRQYPFIVSIAQEAYQNNDITPISRPMRGGTDGAIISQMGLPTPNLFSGTENSHGKYEFVTAESIQQSINVIADIVSLTADYSSQISKYPTFTAKQYV